MSDQSFENEWVLEDGKDVQKHDALHQYQKNVKRKGQQKTFLGKSR
jgi:hypothetical protein